MKKFLGEQKHFIRQPTDKVAGDAKKTKELLFAHLCALAPLREIVYFFTPSNARATAGRMCALRPQDLWYIAGLNSHRVLGLTPKNGARCKCCSP